MTGRDELLAPRRWRAPTNDGEALLDPPLVSAGEVLHSNRKLLESSCLEIGGRPLAELTPHARREFVLLARKYTSAYRQLGILDELDDSAPLLLAGHQPHLAHPGVWFKTFVLSSLGKRLSACPINLLIDNDTLRAPSIRVPGGSHTTPLVHNAPFDAPGHEVPYEEREIIDSACFDSFGSRAADLIRPFVPGPLVNDLWPLARQAARRGGNLGRALAEGRHRLEESLGLSTLEIPLGMVCDTESFRWFAASLLAELPRLQQVYNSSLAEYRRLNRIRSRSHPVPDLVEQHGFFEAPFWVWTRQNPRRRRLFVRSLSDRLELTDNTGLSFELPPAHEDRLDRIVEQLAVVCARGIKIRPRALLTTMYARLVLCDLFVHGIGGSKYDQLTDAIIARFFSMHPPAFLTATATLRLPIERPGGTADELRRLDAAIREIRFHPERFLADATGEARTWIAKKQRWLAEKDPRQRRLRHQGIHEANAALASFVEERRQKLADQRQELASRLRAAKLLGSREYSFCLFPSDSLVPVMRQMAAP